MRSSTEAHRANRWRVHALAADFEVIDVWRFDLRGGKGGFVRFVEVFWAGMAEAEGWTLSRMRVAIGRLMGWDQAPHSLPIPGRTETSVADRLTAGDRQRNLVRQGEPSPLPAASVKAVYRFDDEALFEVSNDTVHALLHLSQVDGDAELAVYIKSRGLFTRLYMAAIRPFRHLYLYPRLIARIEELWRTAPVGGAPAGD
jgi:hypothetical protein